MAVEQSQTFKATAFEDEARGPSDFQLAIRELKKRPPAILGIICLLFVVLFAIVPQVFSPLDPVSQDLNRHIKPPGFIDKAGNVYHLGTDEQGRDILSRIIWGSRISLIVGIAAVFFSGIIGITIGIVAGYFGGWVDTIISRIIDTALAVPFILLAISLVAILGPSLQNIILVISLRTWIVYARVVRGEVLSIKENEFIVGAKAAGCGTLRILIVYLFPNVISTTIVIATLYLGRMIIIESALSFLGLGVPPPTPTWGGMLADGRSFLDTAWWISLFPGIVLMLTVLSVNVLGDLLRDVLDPKMKRLAD
ncbi:MAG: ABC transporter permease [Nitrospinaceae bacterium]|jgi:peptide/nickel transport system permease protein|nr:ABC transporter permease [Nitrospinaceae bacterium]MBT3435938.1 ABC transporter permease [Nitrospinaceae bacterium]MBT3820999.1 ABC transporter permease [Nitrospinaceae bacterium]MBT4094762.1 ABC transporter permease [Nitrospinaceae bacterium]MBT4432049.1 ABC transporter permease [Nitrospinaceae bacterium]